jgi:hypothetical protein
MPDNWDATVYCQRAAAWRQRAATLREDDDQQDACVAIAEGYERLASLIEAKAQRLQRSLDDGRRSDPSELGVGARSGPQA